MLDFSPFKALTFDCYGTLIDWESGIFSAVKPMLQAHGKTVSDTGILELYGEFEAAAESGEYRTYREVLRSVVRSFGHRMGFSPSAREIDALPDSVQRWKPFPDTVDALQRLATRYQIFIISNIDDDMFAATSRHLGVKFDGIVTAEQARSYKPSLNNFRMALARLSLDVPQVLHVGQSIYHDVIPAKSLGLRTVWVNRPSPRPDAGATIAASGRPDLEVSSLGELAARAVP